MSKRSYEKGQRAFEGWMRRYWAGIKLTWLMHAEEYEETAAQTAWEVWRRFTKKIKGNAT